MIPLCTVCRKHPAKRSRRADAARLKMGPRVINGEYWTWTCSRSCSTSYSRKKALQSRLRKAQQRHVEWLAALVKPHMDAEGKVPATVFVREVVKAIKTAYNRGYSAAVWPRQFEEYRG